MVQTKAEIQQGEQGVWRARRFVLQANLWETKMDPNGGFQFCTAGSEEAGWYKVFVSRSIGHSAWNSLIRNECYGYRVERVPNGRIAKTLS